MRARENQGRERIKGSGEAQLVESEQDKIRRRSGVIVPSSGRPRQAADPVVAQRSASRGVTRVTP
jgi:hypothetical protein